MIVLSMNIALDAPFPSTNLHCSSAISGLILFLTHIITILRSIFVTWLIRLIVRWSSHSVAPAFFRSAMKTDFSISFGICPVSYILLRSFVIFEIPNFSRACCSHFIFHNCWSCKINFHNFYVFSFVVKKFLFVFRPSF